MRSFTSLSEQVKIDPKDWNIGTALGVSHKPLTAPYSIGWDHHFAYGDETPVRLSPDRIEVRHVIATGLTNGAHRITIRAIPDVRAAIASLRLYRPPLTD